MHSVAFVDGASSESAAKVRRSAVLRLGSGGLATLLATRIIPAGAQEASPTAGVPAAGRAYVAVRPYQFAPGRTMEELLPLIENGFVPILRQVPGFLDYYLVETSDGVLSMSVFTDDAGAEESTRRAADFVQQNLAHFYSGPPTVTTGSVWLHDLGGAASGAPAP